MNTLKQYLTLYKKEVRFLTGPGIAMIVLIIIPVVILFAIWFTNPDFYREYIMMRSDNRPFIVQFVIMPLLLLSSIGMSFMYAVLFLYSVMIEHMARTRYQLAFLPIVKFSHLITKLAAVISWLGFNLCIGFIFITLMNLLFRLPGIEPLPGRAALSDVIMFYIRELANTFMLISLIALGYSLALYIRRIPYLIGTVTVIAGYALVLLLRMHIFRYFSKMYPFSHEVSWWFQMMPWIQILFHTVTALVFLVPALCLYERFSEV